MINGDNKWWRNKIWIFTIIILTTIIDLQCLY